MKKDAKNNRNVTNLVETRLDTLSSDQVLRKRAVELQTVAEVSTAVASIRNIEEMLHQAVRLTQRGFGLCHAHVFLYNEKTAELEIIACGWKEGDEHENLLHGAHLPIPLAQKQSLVARAGRTRQAVIVNDVHNEAGWLPNPQIPDTASEMAIPLVVGDRLLGVLDVQSDKIDHFTQEDINIQTTLAGQISIALQNARTLQEANIFRMGIEQSDQAVFFTSPQGEITYVNNTFEKVYGYTASEAIGQNPRLIKNGQVAPDERVAFVNMLERKQALSGEVVNRHKDGRLIHVDGSNIPVMNAKGELTGVLSIHRDITERKQAELALRKSEENLTTALAQVEAFQSATNAAAIVAITDVQGRIEYVNDNFIQISQYSREELIGKNHRILNSGYHSEQFFRDMWVTIANGRVWHGEVRNRAKDGSFYWVYTSISPILNEYGKPEKYLAVRFDITERKQAEEALHQNEARLTEAAEIAKLGYWEFDVPTQMLTCSEQLYALLRTSSAQEGSYQMPIMQYVERFIHPDDRQLAGVEIQKSLETTDPNYAGFFEHRIIRTDGSQGYITVRVKIIKDSQGRTVKTIGINQDITERKQAEEIIAERASQLETVAALSTTVSTVLEPDKLLQNVVDLTRERFNLYHAHIYVLDETETTLGLSHGAGDVGRALVASAHSISLESPKSLVARAARERLAVIVNDVQTEPGFLPNSLLPDTRSEMAVPMLIGDKILGVFDVQSTTANHFTDEDAHIYAILASQVAVALQNARQYTQVTQAEYALRVSQQLLQLVMNNIPQAVFWKDRDLHYLGCNQAFAEDAGLVTPQDIIGKTDYDLPWTAQADVYRADDRLVMESGAAKINYEEPQTTATGETTWLRTSKIPMRDTAGKVTAVLGTYEDITERKRTEESLRQSESKLAEAASIAKLGYWEFDLLTDTYTFTDQFYALLRTTAEREGGYRMSSKEYTRKFMHPNDGYMVDNEIQKSLENVNADLGQFEHRFVRADGSEGYITGRSRVVKDAQGRTVKTIGFNQDITESKQAEEALRRSEQLMRTVIDSTPDWIFIKDQEHRYRLVNQGYASALHLAPEDFIGKNDLDLGFPEELVKGNPEKGIRGFWADDRLVMDSNQTQIYSDDPATIDGVLHTFHTIKTPLRALDGEPWGVLAFARDITERKQMEGVLQRNQERLSEAARLARFGYWDYNGEQDLFTFDDNFYAMLHTTAEAQGGHQMSPAEYIKRFLHPDDVPLILIAFNKAVASTEREYIAPLEYRVRYADGGVGHVFVFIRVLHNDEGRIILHAGTTQDITERKQTENLLVAERNLLNTLIENLPENVFVKDADSHIVLDNVAHRRALGAATLEDVIGKTDFDFFPEELAAKYYADEQWVIQSGTALINREEPVMDRDGNQKWLLTTKVPLRDIQGIITGIVGVNYDITERKQMEVALIAREQEFRSLAESSPDFIIRYDAEHRMRYINNNLLRRLMLADATEVIGKRPIEAWPDGRFIAIDDAAERAIKSGNMVMIEISAPTETGEMAFSDIYVVPERDVDGKIIGAIAFGRDVTERKQAEETIARRAADLATVAAVSTTTSTVLNPDQLIQSVVDLTKERFNLYHVHIYLLDESRSSLLLAAGAGKIGQAMTSAGHTIQTDAPRSLVAQAYRDHEVVIVNDIRRVENFLPNPFLSNTHAELAVPMIVGDKVLGVFDLQSEKTDYFTEEDALIFKALAAQVAVALQNARLYQEQSATVTQLREVDRIKTSFLANMSHELRTPMNSILGFTDVLLSEIDGTLTEPMENDLRLIQKSGRHLLHLINDVLDMAKIEAGMMNLHAEYFNLYEMLDEVINIVAPLAESKHLVLKIDDKSERDVEVCADRGRIRQVLLNLVNNSIKFTEQGQVGLLVIHQDDNALVRVKDTGIGIPTSKLETIFQEFTQVDTSTTRKVGGTGLGLPISRRLVDMHGGRLWAQSTGNPGEGSTFYIELPLEIQVKEDIES